MEHTEELLGEKSSELAKMLLGDNDWLPENNSKVTPAEEEITFRPLTEGLGFSKSVNRVSELKRKSVRPAKLANDFRYVDRPPRQKTDILNDLSARAVSTKSTIKSASAVEIKPDADLSIFYGGEASTTKNKKESKVVKKKKRVLATAEARFTAWVIDIVFITLMVLGFLLTISWILNFEFSEVVVLENTSLMVGAWALFYMIYFTILDLDRSFGKSFLKIKTVKTRQRLSIVDTFVRTLISLLSIVGFGIPALFDLHGHLSDTVVIRWK